MLLGHRIDRLAQLLLQRVDEQRFVVIGLDAQNLDRRLQRFQTLANVVQVLGDAHRRVVRRQSDGHSLLDTLAGHLRHGIRDVRMPVLHPQEAAISTVVPVETLLQCPHLIDRRLIQRRRTADPPVALLQILHRLVRRLVPVPNVHKIRTHVVQLLRRPVRHY